MLCHLQFEQHFILKRLNACISEGDYVIIIHQSGLHPRSARLGGRDHVSPEPSENILSHSAAIGGTLSTSKAIFANRGYSNRRSTQYLMGSAFGVRYLPSVERSQRSSSST
ncbi:hypothetical protein N657DRAFT_651289, partial [Parathielavia appendiculata]